MADHTAEQLALTYINIRDHIKLVEKRHEEELAEPKAALQQVKQAMLNLCESVGADSLKTDMGTISRVVDTTYSIQDWDEFHRFLVNNNLPGLLQKRVHQQNLKSFMEEHPDTAVPTLVVNRTYDIQVRKPTSKG